MRPSRARGASGEERGRGVAAGRPDDRHGFVPQGGQLVAVELREAVDGAAEEVGPRVLEAVPARVVGGVAEPEVGAEVDDRRAGGGEVGDDLGRRAVGEGEEDRVRVGDRRVDVEARPVEVDVGAADRLMAPAPPDEPDDLDVRVSGQQAHELGPDVPGGAHDRNPDARPAIVARAAGEWHGPARCCDLDRRSVRPRAHGRSRDIVGRRAGQDAARAAGHDAGRTAGARPLAGSSAVTGWWLRPGRIAGVLMLRMTIHTMRIVMQGDRIAGAEGGRRGASGSPGGGQPAAQGRSAGRPGGAPRAALRGAPSFLLAEAMPEPVCRPRSVARTGSPRRTPVGGHETRKIALSAVPRPGLPPEAAGAMPRGEDGRRMPAPDAAAAAQGRRTTAPRNAAAPCRAQAWSGGSSIPGPVATASPSTGAAPSGEMTT